jgi:hypothetical protein
MITGLLVAGKIKGVRNLTFGNYTKNLVGVSSFSDDGYGGQQEVITEISVSEQDIKSGILNQIEAMKGKDCNVPVYVRCYTSKQQQAQFEYSFDSKRGIQELAKPLKAAI